MPGSGKRKGGAVIRRCANEGQAERDIHAIRESERLERDERLIVVHGENGVIALARGVVKQGIRRMRSGCVNTLSIKCLDRRRDHLDFFAAKRSIFSGVRI